MTTSNHIYQARIRKCKAENPQASVEIMAILWNGGWDDYLVDLNDQINEVDGSPGDPIIVKDGKSYVRTLFCGALAKLYPGKAVRSLMRLDCGD